jgi:hypothetical protein
MIKRIKELLESITERMFATQLKQGSKVILANGLKGYVAKPIHPRDNSALVRYTNNKRELIQNIPIRDLRPDQEEKVGTPSGNSIVSQPS